MSLNLEELDESKLSAEEWRARYLAEREKNKKLEEHNKHVSILQTAEMAKAFDAEMENKRLMEENENLKFTIQYTEKENKRIVKEHDDAIKFSRNIAIDKLLAQTKRADAEYANKQLKEELAEAREKISKLEAELASEKAKKECLGKEDEDIGKEKKRRRRDEDE
jgi:hypothetical protein